MATSYLFKCNKCSYEAILSDGKGYGFSAVIETMTCTNCREMVNVLIGARGKEGKTGDPETDKILGLCPKCKGSNVAKGDHALNVTEKWKRGIRLGFGIKYIEKSITTQINLQ